MATPLNPWIDGWGGQTLGRWQARRLSQHFAAVGIGIAPSRLREMAAGAPAADDEMVDVSFAFAATEIQREQRRAKFERARRCAILWLIATAVGVVLLILLGCVAYATLSLTGY